MKHIKRDRFVLPAGWEEKARQAYVAIQQLPPEERAEAINKKSTIWKSLKKTLSELSHGKCWYCESLETTCPGDVDHFRPKNEVEECPQHPGYWWQAFTWKNYRYGCELCNRRNTDPVTNVVGGKDSAFPLWDETKRVLDNTDPLDTLCEEPMLLDPTVASDREGL